MKKTETTAKNLAFMIASELHEDWRKTRLREDGTYEPRWKEVMDKKYVELRVDLEHLPDNMRINEGVVEIDIANSHFIELSPDKQKENYEAALVCVDILFNKEAFSSIEQVGDKIHEEWLKRNEWGRNDPVLSKPFSELPKEEQDKDIDQFKIATTILEQVEKKMKSKDEELSLF